MPQEGPDAGIAKRAAVRVISAIWLAGACGAVRFAAIHIGPANVAVGGQASSNGRRADVTG